MALTDGENIDDLFRYSQDRETYLARARQRLKSKASELNKLIKDTEASLRIESQDIHRAITHGGYLQLVHDRQQRHRGCLGQSLPLMNAFTTTLA